MEVKMLGIYDNEMKLEFVSKSSNEAFARIAVAAFASQLDPTIEELADIKTAVSEAVTNSIIHGYENTEGIIKIVARSNSYVYYICVDEDYIGRDSSYIYDITGWVKITSEQFKKGYLLALKNIQDPNWEIIKKYNWSDFIIEINKSINKE